ncbi:MAG: MBL fold metallo-hydrolase [Spirochaetia bacterium]|nr:MBL fold metallo-hydrolase [Spirochaetia bacterium]
MKDKIRLQFLGAVGYVTGSRTLIETENTRVYVDAGLYQGPRYIEEKNFLPLETDASKIDAILLTHAHIDHSGFLPLLIKKGFQGAVYCTYSTAKLLEILLPDAGRLQEEEYKFYSKKKITQYNLDGPLFTEQDAIKALDFLKPVSFNKEFKFQDFKIKFFWAGHIVGASYIQIKINKKTILFSGDIGPVNTIFHKERENPPPADYVIIESTYGTRLHEKEDYTEKMQHAIKSVIKKKGMLIIPSFAVGRTQLVLYVLFKLIKEKKIQPIPIFLDSPMATRATKVYLENPNEIKNDVIKEGFLEFMKSDAVKMIEDVAESKRLNYYTGPGIIVSASGMCSGGRIMHHLFNRLWDRRNVLLFAGYQANGTLGRTLLEGALRVKIFNRELPVRCSIEKINSFSAHADQNGLISWVKSMGKKQPQKIFINHGEDESREELKKKLTELIYSDIEIPKSEYIYYL